MLKLVLRHGLKLKKVHKMLSFKQKPWIEPYVDVNSVQRQIAKTSFDKDLFKMNLNASYGKHLENIMNRCDIRLITKWEGRYGLEAQIAKPNFKRNVIFHENLVACEMTRLNVMMTKPTIVGIAILDISKCLMYEFHYDFIMKHFNEKICKILYTDTDSFLYEFTGESNDPYEFMRKHSNEFDTSDYPKINPFGIQQLNKKVLGLMKDELKGELIEEFIGLRAKMYAIRTSRERENEVIKRAKGVKTNVLEKKISFKDYKKCIEEQKKLRERVRSMTKRDLEEFIQKHCTKVEKQSCMRSIEHTVYNITSDKKVLDPFDDKRYLIPGSHSTYAWGHKNIR